MRQNALMIDIPRFTVSYEEEKYSYSKSDAGKRNLKAVLYKASRNYCMYCYNRIKIDGNEYGHLEHSIEKTIASEELTECIPNIGIACPICNDKYKRIGEKLRKPKEESIKQFKSNVCCKENCNTPCEAYLALKKEYLKKKNSQFLMQPLGVTSEEIGIDAKQDLLLQYDVIDEKCIPSTRTEYSKEEMDFLYNHIDMFHLNSSERKMNQLFKFLLDTIEREGKYTYIDYNNLVIQLFVEQFLQGKAQEEIFKICKKLYVCVASK